MADDSLHPQQTSEPGPRERRSALGMAGLIVVLIAIVLVVGSIRIALVRSAQAEALKQGTSEQQKVYVVYAHPKASGSDGAGQVQLPGTLIGGRETSVYARSSGYVRRWMRDIGARVNKGEPIVDIESPEVDKQTLQARANAHQAEVNLTLAQQTLTRWQALRKDDLVTEQDVAERHSAVDQLTAALAASQAEVARLESLSGFEHVVAPFTGVITHRNVEVGMLVNAGNGGATQSLLDIASTDRLRLDIYVPQAYSSQVKVGMPVDVIQAELGGQHFPAHVARTAGAIDPVTRTLAVELDVPNPDGRLLPGAYVLAALPLLHAQTLSVPANALLFRAEGPRVAVVDAQGKVRLAQVGIGRDLGKTIEIVGGLQTEDRIVLNPPDALADNDIVDAHEAPAAKEATAPTAAGAAAAAPAPMTGPPGAATPPSVQGGSTPAASGVPPRAAQ